MVNLIGVAASILGLIFSILAWLRAKDAKKAAEEARKAVRQGNAAEDLQRLATKARELLHFVENDQFNAARIRSGDLILDITHAQHRWKVFLPEENRAQLAEAGKKAGLVTRALAIVEEEIEPENRTKLVNACREVVSRLAAESGNIQSEVDREN
jgi:hypothetical protein